MAYKLTSVRPCGDGGWRVYISDDAGHLPPIRRRIRSSDQEEANRIANRILAEVVGEWTVRHAFEETIRQAAATVTPQTLREYQALSRIFEPIYVYRVDEVSPCDVQSIIDSSSHSASVARKALTLARRAFDAAVSAGGAEMNPAKAVSFACPKKARREPVDEERLASVLRIAQGKPAAVLGLICFCGLSVGEIAVLELRKTRGQVQGRATRRSKGDAGFIPYESPTFVDIPEWLREKASQSNPSSPNFPFGSPDNPGNVDLIAREARSLLRTFGFEITLAQLRGLHATSSRRRTE